MTSIDYQDDATINISVDDEREIRLDAGLVRFEDASKRWKNSVKCCHGSSLWLTALSTRFFTVMAAFRCPFTLA